MKSNIFYKIINILFCFHIKIENTGWTLLIIKSSLYETQTIDVHAVLQ